MIYINPETLLTVTLLLCVLVSIRSMFLRRKLAQNNGKLVAANSALEAAARELETLRQVEKRFQDFKANLNQAELATKMQQPRLQLVRECQDPRTPERYQFVHSLARKGIAAPEIASILAISPQEADQLVTLANLSSK